jgi:hypothetical protein
VENRAERELRNSGTGVGSLAHVTHRLCDVWLDRLLCGSRWDPAKNGHDDEHASREQVQRIVATP